jgi:hypothetical protein
VIRGKREPTTLEINVQDPVSVANRSVLRAPGETTDGIRVANDRISSADDLYSDGTVEFSVAGRPAQGAESDLLVCDVLRQHLNQSSEIWKKAAKPQGQEKGVDGELRHRTSGSVLKMQVVRAEAGAELRRKVAQQGSAGGVLGTDALADVLQLAIDHKRTRAYPDIVLALDATETSRFAFAPVVASFRRRHGAWAKQVGFKEIWVVAPIPDPVERLDIQEWTVF